MRRNCLSVGLLVHATHDISRFGASIGFETVRNGLWAVCEFLVVIQVTHECPGVRLAAAEYGGEGGGMEGVNCDPRNN